MTRRAPRVCTAPADIERVLALIPALPAHGEVILHMRDGGVLAGVVHVRGSAQVFRDQQGQEGMNVLIHLETADTSRGRRPVWLDQVQHVEHVDPAMGREN